MNKVQLILIPIFILATIAAVLIFSGAGPGLNQKSGKGSEIKFWAPYPRAKMDFALEGYRRMNSGLKLIYEEKENQSYYSEIIDGLASNSGPDIFALNQERILKFKDKIFEIPFEAFNLRKFKDSFLGAGEIFLSKSGILGFPLFIDPVVLYWNRDLFGNDGFSRPPQTWDEFLTYSQALTKIDSNKNILQSGSALGEFSNVLRAKDIISLLILQGGSPIVERETLEVKLESAESAVRFFNQFRDSRKKTFSWAKNLPLDKEFFLQGKLAMYFGFASEYREFKEKNPYLNFDAALVPQVRGAKTKITYAKIEALAVSKLSVDKKLDFNLINYLISPEAQKSLQEEFFTPSVLNSLLAFPVSDPTMEIFRQSALISRVWIDPEPEKTYLIFKDMNEGAASEKKGIEELVRDAGEKLKSLLGPFIQPNL